MNIILQAIVYFFAIWVSTANASGVTTFYHNDLLGSPVAATDDRGNVLWSEKYYPYGERQGNAGASQDNDLWYTGKQHDEDTGLTYFNARHYDPVVGRFMSIDPAGVVAGNLHSFNRYAYANNNPYKYIDPDGRSALVKLVKYVLNGGDLAVTFADSAQDVAVLANSAAPPTARLMAALSLASEVAPVSLHDAQDAYGFLQGVAKGVSNPVPGTIARVVPDNPITRASGTLGRPGADDVFVTAADDIRGLNAKQIAERLTIPESPTGFRVIEFPAPKFGIASPVNRTDPGFIGGGRTAGGAREFVIPNGAIPAGSSTRVVP